MSLQRLDDRKSSGSRLQHSRLKTGRRERPREKESGPADGYLTYALFALLFLCIAAVAYIVLNPPLGEKYTEFYILGPGEKASDYPVSLKTNQSGTVIIGVVNKEQEPVEYVLRVRLDNETLQEKDLSLADGQAYKARFTFTPHTSGERRKMEFLLYKKGYSTPYRDLHLWIDVKAGG